MKKIQQPLKGFRDYLPEKMMIRNEVISRLREVFTSFGFEELQTPTLEYQEVLLGKYGEEAEKLMYLFEDQGGRKVGMRYDLTVPLARVVSSYPNLPKPFKRFQVQPAWRAENTQKGRYREFYQCDVDTVGSSSPISDAEILSVISKSMERLELLNYTIRVNSRTVLFSAMEKAGIEKNKWATAIQSIDKLDKKERDEIEAELRGKGFTDGQVVDLFNAIKSASPDDFLNETMSFAKKTGANNIVFDPILARGLDYYTGPIFETVVSEPKMGSITGGGRYDELLSTLGGPDLPATGTTIGLDRVSDVIEELGLWNKLPKSSSQVFVTIFSMQMVEKSLEVTNSLRDAGIKAEVSLTPELNIGKQIKYADTKNIPWVVVIGPEETERDVLNLKNMTNGEQKVVSLSEAIEIIKK